MALNNILIINQPLGNRGDESAHRALVRSLNKAFPKTKITILNYLDYKNAEKEFVVEHPNNEYVRFVFKHNLGASPLDRFLTQWGFVAVGVRLHPILRRLLPYYKRADLVLCAPGGICMGGFQNWRHLFLLQVAKVLHKPLAYYSRSFGPFPTETWKNRRFKKLALDILHYFDFLSIRDAETMRLADNLGVKYVPAIDTAFLEQQSVKLPIEIQNKLSEKYIVFIPNSLTWHYAYKKYTQNIIDGFYICLMQELRVLYPDHQILMLPQLCSLGEKGDYNYFKSLLHKYHDDNVFVVPDIYGSDIQQAIIRNAGFVVGARYHSIVFAINNNVPFLALNYEHKIAGLLDALDLSKYKIDIKLALDDYVQSGSYIHEIREFLQFEYDSFNATNLAHHIASKCFNCFVQKYQ